MRVPKNFGGGGGTVFFLTGEARQAGWNMSFITAAGETWIKPYPVFNGKEIVPQVLEGTEDLSPEERISEFIAVYQSIVFAGTNKISGVVETHDEIEGAGNLYRVFYNNLIAFQKKSIKELSDWEMNAYADLQEFTKDKKKPMLSRTQQLLFIKGALFQLNGEGVFDENQDPAFKYKSVLRCSVSGYMDMKHKLLTPADPQYAFSPENSLLGDIVTPETGAYIKLFAEKIHLKEQNIDQNRYYVEAGEPLALEREYIWDSVLDHGRFNGWDNLIMRPGNTELATMLAATFSPELVWIGLCEWNRGTTIVE